MQIFSISNNVWKWPRLDLQSILLRHWYAERVGPGLFHSIVSFGNMIGKRYAISETAQRTIIIKYDI